MSDDDENEDSSWMDDPWHIARPAPKPAENVAAIITWQRHQQHVWGDGAYGWAGSASDTLARSRLDRLTSLAENLARWLAPPAPHENDGALILAWANIGTLVEGNMLFALTLFTNDYERGEAFKKGKREFPKVADVVTGRLMLGDLVTIFTERVWATAIGPQPHMVEFASLVQSRRNAVHAFEDREIGTHAEFLVALAKLRVFLKDLPSQDEPPAIDRETGMPY